MLFHWQDGNRTGRPCPPVNYIIFTAWSLPKPYLKRDVDLSNQCLQRCVYSIGLVGIWHIRWTTKSSTSTRYRYGTFPSRAAIGTTPPWWTCQHDWVQLPKADGMRKFTQLLMVYLQKNMQCWLEIQLLANLFCGVSRAFLKHQMVDVATISKAHCTRKHCPNCIGSRKRKQTSTVQSLFKLLRNSTVHIFCTVIYIYNISSSSSSSPSKSPLKPRQNTCFTCRLEHIYIYCKIDNYTS